MSFCLYVRLFVRLSETCVAAGARAAVDGRQRPHRCCTAHTTGVPDVSSAVKNFTVVEFMLVAGAYSWRQ